MRGWKDQRGKDESMKGKKNDEKKEWKKEKEWKEEKE